MYFENSRKNYYRFPSKTNATEFDTAIPYYFPSGDTFKENHTSKVETPPNNRNTIHTEITATEDNTFH